MANCAMDQTRAGSCRDSQAAWHLQLIAIAVILITSVVGISLPIMLAQIFQGKPTYNKIVLLIKCFAAGVILSTSLVHVLPDAFEALSDCQVASRHPWRDFPFSGFIAMIGALVALLVDIAASSHAAGDSHYTPIGSDDASSVESKKAEAGLASTVMIECHDSHRADELVKLKQRLVSQVLEIGIIFHSVIIGVTLGMSQNKCTIRPLVAALAFHQIFEGMGLGGCIAQVKFRIFYLLVGHIGCVRGIQTVHLLCFAVDGTSTGEIMVDRFLLEDFLLPYNCNLHKSSNPVSGLDGLS